MKYTAKHYAVALMSSIEGNPSKTDFLIKNFINTLTKHRRLSLIKSIIQTIKNGDYQSSKMKVLAKVASKSDVKAAQNLFTGDFEMETMIDPSLIAGTEIIIGDMRITNSLKSRIANLKKAITN